MFSLIPYVNLILTNCRPLRPLNTSVNKRLDWLSLNQSSLWIMLYTSASWLTPQSCWKVGSRCTKLGRSRLLTTLIPIHLLPHLLLLPQVNHKPFPARVLLDPDVCLDEDIGDKFIAATWNLMNVFNSPISRCNGASGQTEASNSTPAPHPLLSAMVGSTSAIWTPLRIYKTPVWEALRC